MWRPQPPAQRGRGDLMTGPAECQVELAELVVETIPHADWVLFAKNGTDATTACVTIARAGTQRRKVLVAKGSYHGAAPWCTPSLAGVTAEDRAHILRFDYNDVASLERAADEAGRDLAAVLVTAFKHDVKRHQEAPTLAFAQAVRRICDAADAALILDDVRAGFRLHIGGSWEPYGVRPDLCAWSKAIANGHPLAAVTGADRFRDGRATGLCHRLLLVLGCADGGSDLPPSRSCARPARSRRWKPWAAGYATGSRRRHGCTMCDCGRPDQSRCR